MNNDKVTLNNRNQPTNSPAGRQQVPDTYVPWQFGRTQKYQGRQVKVSKLNIKNPGTLSLFASGTGAIGNGSTLFVSTTLTFNSPHVFDFNFAIPYLAIYAGTQVNTNNQLYPTIGGSQHPGSYSVTGWFDYDALINATPGSIESVWSGYITNNSGALGTILFVSQWKYLLYNSGSVTG